MRSDRNNRKKIVYIQRCVVVAALIIIAIVISKSCGNSKENDGKRIIKKKVIEIPEGCGTYATREWDLNRYQCAEGTRQRRIEDMWHKKGTEDSNGFQKLYDRYLIACTDTFGRVGARIDFYMSDGTVLECIIYDNKSREKTFYDQNPANKWGHDNGKVVLEFVGSAKLGTSPYKKLGLENVSTVKAVRYDNILTRKTKRNK